MKKKKVKDSFGWGDLGKAVWYFLGKHRERYVFLISVLALVFFCEMVPPFILGKNEEKNTNIYCAQGILPKRGRQGLCV